MGKIKLLPIHEAQRIAAGEVVERPAHVLKELLENSLDAAATEIIVYLEEGGKNLVQVIDNGCGMSPEDARMSMVHHATSKISSVHDLMSLTTFGFRGEALSSMCSVSRILLRTKQAEDTIGLELLIEDSVIISEKPISCNTGTDIAVRDLFYIIPARKKFLKTTATEYRVCSQLFQAIALAYPEQRFQLYHNNSLVFDCPKVTSLIDRAAQLYDKKTAETLLLVSSNQTDITINGVISHHQHMRYDRNQIITLVNKRWIKNHKISQAILKGYCNILLPARYPTAIINITIDPEQIDVNVHPKKEEVQFLESAKVEKLIDTMVKERLSQNIVPQETHTRLPERYYIPELTYKSQKFSIPTTQEIVFKHIEAEIKLPQELIFEKELVQELVKEKKHEYTILAQLHKTYMLLETVSGLLLIDQHAAHEAVLFEKFSTKTNRTETNNLIVPELLSLNTSECATAVAHNSFFKEHGIIFELFGHNQIKLIATPIGIKNQSIKEIIQETISYIHEHEKQDADQLSALLTKKLYATMACKAAVKGGDILSYKEMEELITIFYNANYNLTCPHGRPTCLNLSVYDIEKKFKRI